MSREGSDAAFAAEMSKDRRENIMDQDAANDKMLEVMEMLDSSGRMRDASKMESNELEEAKAAAHAVIDGIEGGEYKPDGKIEQMARDIIANTGGREDRSEEDRRESER